VTGSELATFKVSATAISVSISEVVSLYKRNRVVNRAKLQQLQLQAEQALREARTRAVANLARVNIEEIAATQRYIDSLHLNGAALDYAMLHLEQLSVQLADNLKRLGHA
jgi:hypothetical protein